MIPTFIATLRLHSHYLPNALFDLHPELMIDSIQDYTNLVDEIITKSDMIF